MTAGCHLARSRRIHPCHVIAIGKHSSRGREASALPASDSAHSQRNAGAQAAEALDGRGTPPPPKANASHGRVGGGLDRRRLRHVLGMVAYDEGVRCGQARIARRSLDRTPKEIGRPGRFQMAARRRAKPPPALPPRPCATGTPAAKQAGNGAAGKKRPPISTPRTPIAPAPRSEPFAPTRGRKSHATAPRRSLRWRHDLNEAEKSSRA